MFVALSGAVFGHGTCHIIAMHSIQSINQSKLLCKAHSNSSIFYRETLSVRAVLAVGRCPSVCPSHSCIVSKWLKISSHFFFAARQPHNSSFFLAQVPLHNSKGNPFVTALRKIPNFRLICWSILEGVQDVARSCYETLIGSHTRRCPIDLYQFR